MKTKQDIILFQETDKFNQPNVLIDVIRDKRLTTKDKKVYNILIRKLLNQNLENFQTDKIKTSISELCREMNIKKRTDIEDIIKKLSNTSLTFLHKVEDKKRASKVHTKLITTYTLDLKRLDSLTIYFSSLLTQELLLHSNFYTKIDILEMNKLKKKYSLMLLELFKMKLCNYTYQKQNYTEDFLREYLVLEDTYKEYKLFNQKIIKNNIEDINNNTNLTVSYKIVKDKETKKRIYKFFIKQDVYYSLSKFMNTIKNYIKTYSKYNEIVFYLTLNKTKFYLHYQELDDLEQESKILWIYEKTNQTAATEKAAELWNLLYDDFNKDFNKFITETMKMTIEDFILLEQNQL